MSKLDHAERRDHRFWLTALAAMLVITSVAVSVAQHQAPAGVIKNFGKVNANYYRGSQPDRDGFVHLKTLGIRTVIDLRKDSEAKEPPWVRGLGMQYFNIPLNANHAATDDQTTYFLKLVNDPENWPVYVHCKGGRHRTGALTAVYRITHDGWTAERAFDEMKLYDFDHGFFGGPKALKKYVYLFEKKRTASVGQRLDKKSDPRTDTK